MVFYNCQIDVFFHMRSHYNRLKNVQSVVDCSPPKTFSRFNHSDSSFEHVEMAHLPVHSYGLKRHSCGYSNPPKMGTYPSRPRPQTRRHPDDSPQTRLSERSCCPCKENGELCAGCCDVPSKYKNSELFHPTSSSVMESPSKSSTVRVGHENSHKRIVKNNKGICRTPQEKKHQTSAAKLKSDEKLKQCSPCIKKIGFNSCVADQEYLQFLLRITEDIIRYDLYSNEEMKKVFTNHIKANSNRLEMDRMLLKIYELMKELNIPLCCEKGENINSSWADIVVILRSFFRLESMNSNTNKVDDAIKESSKRECICCDLRKKYPACDAQAKKDETEYVNKESCAAASKFEASLDRLTECTEPYSSRATFKVSSTFSNFEDVNILPGFECLETPKVSKAVLCAIHCNAKVPRAIQTLNHTIFARKKLKLRKKTFKKRKKNKQKTKLPKRIQGIPIKECQKQNRTEITQCEISISKHNQEPVVLTLREENNCTPNRNCNESCDTDMKNDYILIQGPVYLSKRFLEEKSIVFKKNQIYIDMKSSNSNNLSPQSHTNENTSKSQVTKNENILQDLISTGEKDEQNLLQNCLNMPVQLDIFPSVQNTLGNPEFFYFGKKDGCGHIENQESKLLCGLKCPHKSNCCKLRLAQEYHAPSVTPANWSEEYDLTPQKEVQQDISKYENHMPALSQIDADNILKTNENQTEDFTQNITVFSLVLANFDEQSKKKSPDFSKSTSNRNKENNVHGKELQKGREKNKRKTEKEKDTESLNAKRKEVQENMIALRKEVNQLKELNVEKKGEQKTTQKNVKAIEEKVSHPMNSNVETKALPLVKDANQSKKSNVKREEVQKTNPEANVSALEKEIDLPKNLNLLMNANNMRSQDYDQSKKPDPPSVDAAFKPKLPTTASSETIPTLLSTATVELTKNFLEVSEEVEKRSVSPVHSANNLSTNNNSDEQKLQHKVSILKNPTMQISTSESDDTRKAGESIIKKVESIKDRQISRDPYLQKVMNDKDSTRHSRASVKSFTAEISERRSSTPAHSVLKSGNSFFSRRGTTDDNPAPKRADSFNDAQLSLDEAYSTLETSEQNLLAQLTDTADLKGSPSQIRQINKVITDLEEFRNGKDVKGETEISATFDKLVQTLKEQQLKEEESQMNIESSTVDLKPAASSLIVHRICCGLCRKRKKVHVVSFIEFEKNALSEEEYKKKSEEFEMALASLGQEPTDVKDIYAAPSNIVVESPESENQLGNMELNTNKVTSVRIADQKENDPNPADTPKNKEGNT